MCLPSKLAEDFNIWCKWKNKPMNLSTFIMFFLKFAEFRALVDYRLKYTKIKFLRYLVHPNMHAYKSIYQFQIRNRRRTTFYAWIQYYNLLYKNGD